MAECGKCDGERRVANTRNQEPWSVWLASPGGAAAAIGGFVQAIDCPICGGTGESQAGDDRE